MAEVKKFEDFEDYADFNRDFINSNPMLYYHLGNTIERVFDDEVLLYDFFNIIDIDCFLVVLFVKDQCLIYADAINNDMVLKLSKEIQFDKFKRFHFFGTKQVIDALFKMHQVEFTEIKHRIIYECKKAAQDFDYSEGELSMGDLNKIEELILFSLMFDKEYYNGLGNSNKSAEKARQFVMKGILEYNNIYQWNYKDDICAIAQAIYDENAYVTIGHLFTNPKFRGKGYAASIVHGMTKSLLDSGVEKCMLTANAYNPASNKAFVKAGYMPTGEYVVRFKEK